MSVISDDLLGPDSRATPDFRKLKKPELILFYEAHATVGRGPRVEEFILMGAPEMRLVLERLVGKPEQGLRESLTDKEVTGFDPDDVIHATVAEVQSIETEDELIKKVRDLAEASEYNFFRIGGFMSEAQARGWCGEYGDFWEFTEAVFGLKKRAVQVHIQVYHALVGCGASWEEVRNIGWSKLMLVAPYLNPDNYKKWLDVAKGGTFSAIQTTIKQHKEALKSGDAAPGELESTPVKKMHFSVHEDEVDTIEAALSVAMESGGTEFPGTALTYICSDFIAGDTEPQTERSKETLASHMKRLASIRDPKGQPSHLDEVVEALESSFNCYVEVWLDTNGPPPVKESVRELMKSHGVESVQKAFDAAVRAGGFEQ